MMRMVLLDLIARNTTRLLLRSMTFWICFVVIIVGVVFLQIMELSSFSDSPTLGEVTLASFFPYMYAVLFSVLQVLPLIFLVKPLRGGDERVDSVEVIYARSESNIEYVWGVAWGFVRVFLAMGVVSMIFSILLHLFASKHAPFDLGIYLFYFLTFVVPTFLFALGLCLCVQTFIRRRALSLILLLMFWGVVLFFVGDYWQDTFDPIGFALPAIFSDAQGFPDLKSFLLHRVGWGLLGVGLIQLSVVGFNRLANNPCGRIRVGMAVMLVLIGMSSLGIYAMNFSERISMRKSYIATANKYAGVPRATLLSATLDYRQNGDEMNVAVEMEFRNQTEDVLDSFVLYLNPELKVTSLQKGKDLIEYERENQAIVVKMRLSPEERTRLTMTYAGGICEDICYLDVPEDEYFDSQRIKYSILSRYGKRNAFLGEDYTLLIPEVLWYPVATLPVDIESPYLTTKDFAFYTLNVWQVEDKMVLSQGKAKEGDGCVRFQNEYPLSGLSLCIGNYEKHTVILDSVQCELCLFKRDFPSFDDIRRYCKTDLKDVKWKVEKRMRKSYPFRRFCLIETPASFTSYCRNVQDGSEYVQPEMVFVPEKFVNVASVSKYKPDDYKPLVWNLDLVNDLKTMLLSGSSVFEHSWSSSYFVGKDLRQFILSGTNADNPYRANQLFDELTGFVKSDEYPVIQQAMRFMTKERKLLLGINPFDFWNAAEAHAREYLNGRSLEEGLEDMDVGLDIQHGMIRLKTRELSDYFQHKGIEPDTLKQFVRMYMDAHPFQSVDFKQFDADFAARFGLSWFDILPQWYKGNELPKYHLQDFSYKAVADPGKRYARPGLVQFAIFNDSDVDGIFKLRYESGRWANGEVSPGTMNEVKEIRYYLKAGTGKRVSLFLPEADKYVELDMGLCANLPWKAFRERENEEMSEYRNYVEAVTLKEMQLSGNEIVVDNEDKGFSIAQSEKRLASLQAGIQSQHDKYDNLYQFAIVDDKWRILMNHTAYGAVNKSLVTRLAGDGTTSANWETDLPDEGWYEVFVYLPNYMAMQTSANTISHRKGEREELNPLYYKNYYAIHFQGEESRIVDLPIDGIFGWISLGCFPSKVGKAKVSLSDKGVVGRQQIIGDAVKWVYLGKDKP